MGSFLLCVVQYVLIMIVLAAIGFCGAFCGLKLRRNKNAKAGQASADAEGNK